MQKLLCLLLLSAAVGAGASAQVVDLPQGDLKDEAAIARAIPELAKRAITAYQEPDRDRYLNTLFRLQIAAGQYSEAVTTLHDLIEKRHATDPASALPLLPFEMLAKARAKERIGGLAFDEAFKQEFRKVFEHLDDKSASEAINWFGGDLGRMRDDLRAAVDKQKGKDRITLTDAVDLIRKYFFYHSFEVILPLAGVFESDDDARRYIIDRDVLLRTPDGAHIAAIVVRPKSAQGPQPALLVFTIYADDERSYNEARRIAGRGYVGVVAYTRGKGRSPDEPVPYEHDGADARAVVDWISKQSWNDGRVGMYGGSYNGFTSWAATKKLHPALRTIVPYVAAIPGLGLPMENNVFLNANYAWAFYVTNNKYLDNETYSDRSRWNALDAKWYDSGKAYRQLDSVDGTPNKWLQRWLQHPAFDKYWQSMVPYKNDFAAINIPILTITGYYDDGQISALQYVKEHYKYDRNANHYLLIGPYDHFGAQSARKAQVLRGYTIDPVAQIDTPEITFQWMDYIFRGGKKPDLLRDRINYEVMGANEWKHAPSLEKMNSETITLFLTNNKSGDNYQLSKTKPSSLGFLEQEVDFADRKTSNNDYYPNLVIGKKPDLSNGYTFVSEPFDEPVEISGTFSGEIKAVINKKDIDVGVVLYEALPNGQLMHLSYFIGRASYAKDISVRKLLTPGKVESIPFDRTRMVSRRLSKGSRLLVTLNINKSRFSQINYGTGKDVSDEEINDARIPLQVRWWNDSYVRIPIWK